MQFAPTANARGELNVPDEIPQRHRGRLGDASARAGQNLCLDLHLDLCPEPLHAGGLVR
jgi:hypothetical protein